MIRFVSVTASQIGSKSSGVGKGGVDEAANKQDEMIDKINEVKAASWMTTVIWNGDGLSGFPFDSHRRLAYQKRHGLSGLFAKL